MSAYLSGPAAGFFQGTIEGLRVYFDSVNADGGVNGHKVKLTIRDNAGDPAQAAKQAREFANGDTLLSSLISISGTYAGYAEIINSSDLASVNAAPCYGPASAPKIDPNFYCVGVSPVTDAYAIVDAFMKLRERTGGGKKPAFVYAAAPGNTLVFEKVIIPLLEAKGVKGVKVPISLTTTELSGIARTIVSSGADSVIAYSTTEQQVDVTTQLLNQGFDGDILNFFVQPGDVQIAKLKKPNLFVLSAYAPVADKHAATEAITTAAKQFKARGDVEDLKNGWALGIAIRAALEKCGDDCDRAALNKTLSSLVVDSDDFVALKGQQLKWNDSIHTSDTGSYLLLKVTEQGSLSKEGEWLKVPEVGFVLPGS